MGYSRRPYACISTITCLYNFMREHIYRRFSKLLPAILPGASTPRLKAPYSHSYPMFFKPKSANIVCFHMIRWHYRPLWLVDWYQCHAGSCTSRIMRRHWDEFARYPPPTSSREVNDDCGFDMPIRQMLWEARTTMIARYGHGGAGHFWWKRWLTDTPYYLKWNDDELSLRLFSTTNFYPLPFPLFEGNAKRIRI